MELDDSIRAELERSPGQSAGTIARRLTKSLQRTITKSDVNSALYGNAELFRSAGSSPPMWWIAGLDDTKASDIARRLAPPRRMSPPVTSKPRRSTLQFASDTEKARDSCEPRRLYAWQAEALEAWRSRARRGVVEAVTGTGKTLVGVVAVEEQIALGGRALVIVPTIELQQQWKRVIVRELPSARVKLLGGGSKANLITNDVVIAVVNSAAIADLHAPTSGALVVADECHRYGADWFAQSLDPRFEARLGLSATYARDDRKHRSVLDPYFGGTCFSMGYPRAVGDDVTAHFKVALVGVRFSPEEAATYERLKKQMGKYWASLVRTHGLPEFDYPAFMTEVTWLAEHGHGAATIAARTYVSLLSERRRLLSESPAKGHGLAKLQGAIRAADRTLLFSQTIEGAERACKQLDAAGLSVAAMSSKDSREDRHRMLHRFEQGRLDVLAAPRVLDEGIDVPEADLAVIVTASRSKRQMVQRMGRVLRRKRDGRLARFALIYVENTTEDPAESAHEDFLDDMDGCADGVRRFDSVASPEEVCSWLNDMTPSEPFPAPRFEGDAPRTPAGPGMKGGPSRPRDGAGLGDLGHAQVSLSGRPLIVSSGRAQRTSGKQRKASDNSTRKDR